MRAGDLDVQIRIADFLPDHFADTHAAESCIGHHKRNLSAGRKTGCDACAVLLGNTDVQILLRQFLPECLGLAAFADINIDDQNVSVFFAEFNNGLTEAVAGRNLFCLHAQASSLMYRAVSSSIACLYCSSFGAMPCQPS